MRRSFVGSACVGLLLVLCVILSGCGVVTQEVTVTVGTPDAGTDFVHISSSKDTAVDIQKEVTSQLTEYVNSGEHNVTQLVLGYEDKYLLAADVYFTPNASGLGNQLRLELMSSSKGTLNQTDADIKAQLERARSSGRDIYRVQPVYISGYLIAAIVVYKTTP